MPPLCIGLECYHNSLQGVPSLLHDKSVSRPLSPIGVGKIRFFQFFSPTNNFKKGMGSDDPRVGVRNVKIQAPKKVFGALRGQNIVKFTCLAAALGPLVCLPSARPPRLPSRSARPPSLPSRSAWPPSLVNLTQPNALSFQVNLSIFWIFRGSPEFFRIFPNFHIFDTFNPKTFNV